MTCFGRSLLTVFVCCLTVTAAAQQVTVATPNESFGDNFFQSAGVNFGFSHVTPNSVMFFRNGGGSAVPPFGGFDPAAGSSFGLRGRKGNLSWSLGLTAGQGSSRSRVATTPMLTLPNGGMGFINSTMQRPFVTGFVPVVGGNCANGTCLAKRFATAASKARANRAREEQEDRAGIQEYQRTRKAKPVRRQLDAPLVLGPRRTADVPSAEK